MKTLGIIALIMLMGCGDQTDSAEKPKTGTAKTIETINLGGHGTVRLISLKDGTVCALYFKNGVDRNGAGIDCNWAKKQPKYLSH